MSWFNLLVSGWILIGVIVLIVLVFTKVRAPYGRHANKNWGPMIDNKLGWLIMELPALLLTPVIALIGTSTKDWFFYLLLILWILHYFNRTLVFPFRIKTKGKKMPLAIVFSAIGFNGMNGFVNGYYLGFIHVPDPEVVYYQPNIIIGILLFTVGMGINQYADGKLIGLRKKSEGYVIPRGGLFEYISCPNHFGEIVEWVGYAVIAWNLPAISFAVWTCCNLVPRTLNHHAWYKEKFPDYPENRKAVIPYLI